MNTKRREKLISSLKDKEYRDAFVSEHIDTGLPFQIKALREKEGWSQEELGSHAGMKQERISTLEDPNYSKFTLKTLKRLASAFDVALMVAFVPFSKLVDWESNLSPESLHPLPFEKDNFSKEKLGEESKGEIKPSVGAEDFLYPDLDLNLNLSPYEKILYRQRPKLGGSALAKLEEVRPNEAHVNKSRSFNLAGSANRF